MWRFDSRVGIAICLLLVGTYFLASAGGGLRVGFNTDDISNMSTYCGQPVGRLIRANLEYWSPFYRPMGAVFYRPLFDAFGFEPLPYRIFGFALLLGNLALGFFALRALTDSSEVAAIAMLITGVQARIHGMELHEAPEQQAGAAQQHNRQCHLRRDERLSQSVRPAGSGSSTIVHRNGGILLDGRDRRNQPEQKTCQGRHHE
ncbi:MAG: hypothetical protein L0219_20605, partial [Phycisphaerales bacterium]|nr:hypothetical protein [Phycisphaerales bacterium]